MKKKHTHLLTELEIKRLYEYSLDNPGHNIWLDIKPNGLGNSVKIYKQVLFKGHTPRKINITDSDNW